jgi:hypothetical protein
MIKLLKGVALAALTLVPLSENATAQCKKLATLLAPNNSGNIGGQIFFDLTVNPPSGVTIQEIDILAGGSTAATPIGTPFSLQIWATPGTYLGNETNMGVWTQVSTGSSVVVSGLNHMDVSDFTLAMGSWGIAIVLINVEHRYTNGTGTNEMYMTPELTFKAGAALNAPWTGTPFTPRVWNGALYYDCVAVTTFCTAKQGLACGVPSISAAGIPSATSGSGFVVSSGPARTCKNGILLYNTATVSPGLPFQGGTLCVDAMGLRRAGPTDSKGTPGGTNCDGLFSLDMNAFTVGAWVVPDCAGNPSGLPPNNPAGFLATPGTLIHTTYWGRDSVATGSFVSNALTYTQGPSRGDAWRPPASTRLPG